MKIAIKVLNEVNGKICELALKIVGFNFEVHLFLQLRYWFALCAFTKLDLPYILNTDTNLISFFLKLTALLYYVMISYIILSAIIVNILMGAAVVISFYNHFVLFQRFLIKFIISVISLKFSQLIGTNINIVETFCSTQITAVTDTNRTRALIPTFHT